MIIDRLVLCDFRSFGGYHDIALTPRVKYGVERPIILFGGLNGAGKTSILMAIKLALYGRHALGAGTPKSEYERFVRSCVHNASGSLVPLNRTEVGLEFTYGKLGRKARYLIKRHWHVHPGGMEESLRLFEDGQELTSLSQDECQGFLSELIPLGVSELFFFDGEKIAELAEDETGGALGDAIRRLLGLDLIERLRTDLRVYAVKYGAKESEDAVAAELDALDRDYRELRAELSARSTELENELDELKDLEKERDRLDLRLTEIGGDWGASREAKKRVAQELAGALRLQQAELQQELSGCYPLSLAASLLQELVAETGNVVEAQAQQAAKEALSAFAEKVRNALPKSAPKRLQRLLDETVEDLSDSSDTDGPLLDISLRELAQLEHLVSELVPSSKVKVAALAEAIASTSSKLDEIGLQIDRAPDAETLRVEMDAYTAASDRLTSKQAEVRLRATELKELCLRAIETARTLRNSHQKATERREVSAPLTYAAKSRLVLKEFAAINAARKVEQLEMEFTRAFQRLARKEDIALRASIDPARFTVKLIDREGREIDKNQLSAGEKQIYAIAMLEALASTSGRRLPVIIDTPLGRLDSKHRNNLVQHYFPRASHQVVLLSTDTEVDEPFYRSLSAHTSHAFEIVYDEVEKRSSLKEGYFWRHAFREAV
jgi:DNA sulfur modification protein DndD